MTNTHEEKLIGEVKVAPAIALDNREIAE